MKIQIAKYTVEGDADDAVKLLESGFFRSLENLRDIPQLELNVTSEVAPKATSESKTLKPKKKSPNKGNSKPVDVKINDVWETFGSIKEAAVRIGIRPAEIRNALSEGAPVGKFKFRYHDEDLDAVLREIDENNKKPYQFAR